MCPEMLMCMHAPCVTDIATVYGSGIIPLSPESQFNPLVSKGTVSLSLWYRHRAATWLNCVIIESVSQALSSIFIRIYSISPMHWVFLNKFMQPMLCPIVYNSHDMH